jgi:hypothetical protein
MKRNSFYSAALDVRRDLRRGAMMTTTMTTFVRLDAAVERVAKVLRAAVVLRGVVLKHADRKAAVAAMFEPLKVRGEVASQADLADFQVVARE